MKLITGLHHVTAITGNAQENIDFYTGVLGLRLVKKTVNFDYSDVYHFYFGDEYGTPGTIMTTFPYGKDLINGRHGKGMLNTTAFSVSIDALDYWMNRLEQFNIPSNSRSKDFLMKFSFTWKILTDWDWNWFLMIKTKEKDITMVIFQKIMPSKEFIMWKSGRMPMKEQQHF